MDKVSIEYKTAVEKIESELKEIKSSNVPAEPIALNLIDRCNREVEFSERVLLKDKTLKECFKYVYSEARKKIKGSSGWLHDAEVYKIAGNYFTMDKVEIETKEPEEKEEDEEEKEEIKEKLVQDKKIIEERQVSLFDL